MASQHIIFLRPPPNLGFVHGFPGIPPDPGRPLASVRGIVELRSDGGAVKARWIKIELRKIETLPGGGRPNTYIDVVGESPVTLWQARNEWDEIQSQDLSFQIRVPETIPPSLTLERSAGIKYELVASMLTEGKKGFLGREPTPLTVTASCQIVIDKHELHSAWPLYTLPQRRSKMLDGYTLTVDRTLHAYGPGDRIVVQALVKNNTLQTNQVRYYELSLREHVMYKPAQNQNRIKKMVAQVHTKSRAIVVQRIPTTMPSALHLGMQAKEELSVHVPFSQTTKTVSFARHIEVQFKIHVRVVLATGLQLFLDFPITMSNWTRAQSIDLVRWIGPTGMLSNPGGIQGFVTAPPDGFRQYSAVASTPPRNPQPQIGWNGGFEQAYFNPDYWAVTAKPLFNGVTLRSSGSFADSWAAGAAERSSTTETTFTPHQLYSVYGNDFRAMPGGSAHPSMTSPTGSKIFMSQLSLHSNPLFNGDIPRVWPSERPLSFLQSPSYGSSPSNALYQSATTSMHQKALPPIPAKGGLGYYPHTAEEKQRTNHKQATKLENRTQVHVYGNESTWGPYEALYRASAPSSPSAPAIAPNLSLKRTRSQSLNQGRGADVDDSLSASLPLSPKARIPSAREEKERQQIYEAQNAAARRLGDSTVSEGPLDPPPYRLLDSSSMPMTRSRAPLPTPPATTGPQPMTAAQEKALLKARYATEDAAQAKAMLEARSPVENVAENGLWPRSLPPLPQKRAASSLPPLSLAPIDVHQSLIPPTFSPNNGELPLPPSFSFVAAPVVAAEENVQTRATYAAEEGEKYSFNHHPSTSFSRLPSHAPNGHTHGRRARQTMMGKAIAFWSQKVAHR